MQTDFGGRVYISTITLGTESLCKNSQSRRVLALREFVALLLIPMIPI